MKSLRFLFLIVVLCLVPFSAWAHVGSKDVYQTITAGPYKLFLTVRMPTVIPGVATVEARSTGASVSDIEITPLPAMGEASRHPPTPDAMIRSGVDPNFFTGSVWMMASGSWQIRTRIRGAAGEQAGAVPVPASPLAILKMGPGLGILLAVLGVFLVVSMASVAGSAVSDATLPPGQEPSRRDRLRGRAISGISLLLLVGIVCGGARWWNVEAASYGRGVYKPPVVDLALNGSTLTMTVPQFKQGLSWQANSASALVPDHGKMIHLYAIRMPQMDAVYHLHPTYLPPDVFRIQLPAMPAGRYKLFGDVVHRNGFPETLVAELSVPAGISTASLGSDDAAAFPPAVGKGPEAGLLGVRYTLPDGYIMQWDRPSNLTANTAYLFCFRLLSPDGTPVPAAMMQNYLGMPGHAAFVKTDFSVFAHTHPDGSAPMPAVMLVNGMEGMDMSTKPTSSTVEFPYGFPKPGSYRIFVQMKHRSATSEGEGIVETGVFDASVKD